MRREERVTVQGPVKEQRPDGMSHGGLGNGPSVPPPPHTPWSHLLLAHCFGDGNTLPSRGDGGRGGQAPPKRLVCLWASHFASACW